MKWMLILLVIIYNSKSFLIPFNPTTSPELHPGNLRLCANCKEARESSGGNGLVCHLFGKIDPIWGKVYYDSCAVVRSNSSLCGSAGRYYVNVYK